jgi:hypothetical protein
MAPSVSGVSSSVLPRAPRLALTTKRECVGFTLVHHNITWYICTHDHANMLHAYSIWVKSISQRNVESIRFHTAMPSHVTQTGYVHKVLRAGF